MQATLLSSLYEDLSLRPHPAAIHYVETRQKLVDVVELMEWAEAIGVDPRGHQRLSKFPIKYVG